MEDAGLTSADSDASAQSAARPEQRLRPGSYDLGEAGPARAASVGGGAAPAAASEVAHADGGVDAFRKQIHAELKRSGAFERIRGMVLQRARSTALSRGTLGLGSGIDQTGQRDADLDILRHILADVCAPGRGTANQPGSHSPVPVPRADRHYLQVDIFDAKAFALSLLQLPTSAGDVRDGGGSAASRTHSLLVLHLHYRGQRSMSLPVALAAEPAFDESVLFDLGPAGPGAPEAEYADILAASEPMQVALMRYDVPADFNVEALLQRTAAAAPRPQASPDAAAPAASSGGAGGDAPLIMSDAAEFGLRQVASRVELLAAQQVPQWQRAVSRPGGVFETAVALTRAGPEAEAFRTQVPVGVLSARFHIVAAGASRADAADADGAATLPVVMPETRRSAWEKECSEASTLALQQLRRYTHVWWRDFTDLATGFKRRTVQIYGEDPGSGEDQLVCKFVTPLQAHHVVEGPLQAARFVSLLGYVAPRSVGQRRLIEKWPCLHSTLVQRCGSARDHAVLLCSLLLGFHLDAFVCVGTVVASAVGEDVTQAPRRDASGDVPSGSRVDDGEERLHYWVMTRNDAHSVTFWESLSARRFRHPPVDAHAAPYDYLRVGCVFNHRYFFANAQPSDEVVHCNFHLENVREWKAMDPRIIKVQSMPVQLHVPLKAPSVDHVLLSAQLETDLKRLVREYREGIRVPTYWNDEISYLLSPALAAYEHERLYGGAGASGTASGGGTALALFQQSIKRAVPEGASFRAYPAQCRFPQARRILQLMLEDPAARVVCETRGSRVRFGLRVRIFPYPENTMAVWFALAVIYLPSRD